MGADPVSLALGGVSTIGNMVGGKNQANQQQQAANAQQQVNQQLLNQEQQLTAPFLQQVAPGVKSLLQGVNSGKMTNGISQQIGGVNKAANNLSGFGGSAQNQQLSNYGSSGANQAVAGFGSNPLNQALAGLNGLKQPELNALTTNAANSGMSDINTLLSLGGGGANQNALAAQSLLKNQMGADSAAVNIGSNASQQEISAAEAAAQNALSGLQTADQYGLQGLQVGTGNALSGLQSGLGGLESGVGEQQALFNSRIGANQSLLGLLSPPSNGLSALGGLSQQYGSQATAGGNPYSAGMNSLGGLGSTIQNTLNGKGGSTGGPSPQPNMVSLNDPYQVGSTE